MTTVGCTRPSAPAGCDSPQVGELRSHHESLRAPCRGVRGQVQSQRARYSDVVWMRAVWGAVVLAFVLLVGFFPGSSTTATVDHCYTRGGERDPIETKCTGHWSALGITVTGRVHGVRVGTDWQVIPFGPGDGWSEVTVPDSARERAAVTVPGAAVVYPVVVWPVRILVLLAVVASAIALSVQIRGRRILWAYERERALG
jgi:hypothetical protein